MFPVIKSVFFIPYQYGRFAGKTKLISFISILLLLSLFSAPSVADTITFNTADETEISIEVTPAAGQAILIWLPSEHGPQAIDEKLVAALGKSGIEVWRIDPFETNFLPLSSSSMDKIPAAQISALITEARRKTGKAVFIFSTGRGAIPLLRGARIWQQQNPTSTALAGAILLTPKFFVETPDPGLEGTLMPIVEATNLPIFILQPDLSPWFWKLEQSVAALEKGGSDVFVQRLRDVRGRFYFRPDATRFEQQFTQQLPALIKQAAWSLTTQAAKARAAVVNIEQTPLVRSGKKAHDLQTYKGNPQPPSLRLETLHGKAVDLNTLRGQVLLVNFWASWCPPCVREMPSMARLANKLRDKPFKILAVNMAEDKTTIKHFINTKVKVKFPVLLDHNGKALRDWRVFAFPTSYVIDRQGRIRYALFGSIEWDSSDIVHKLEKLIKEE